MLQGPGLEGRPAVPVAAQPVLARRAGGAVAVDGGRRVGRVGAVGAVDLVPGHARHDAQELARAQEGGHLGEADDDGAARAARNTLAKFTFSREKRCSTLVSLVD